MPGLGDRVSNRRTVHCLDTGGNKTDLPTAEDVSACALRAENPDLVGLVLLSRRHDPDLLTATQLALLDPDQRVDPEIVIEPGVDDQRFQRPFFGILGWRNPCHDGFTNLLNALTGLCADEQRLRGVNSDNVFNLVPDPVWISSR